MPTHEVINQPPPLPDLNLYTSDKVLVEAVEREKNNWARDQLASYGKLMGSQEMTRLGFLANQFTPILKTHDRFGNRLDEVEFHPAWHEFMRYDIHYGLHSSPWSSSQKGAHLARAVMMFMSAQIESGHGCPISMTYAVVPALKQQPDLFDRWKDKILSRNYDPRFIPSEKKSGVILGMALTEKQGGSDVRANTTTAKPIEKGALYQLTGHKWFCSAPMCDAFLVLAQAPEGLTCFLLPRFAPDGQKNRIFIQRLKDKLGNQSNASSEIELEKALAWKVGEEGRGVRTIIEMVNHTRLDCALGSAGMLRQAYVQALHHTSFRSAFGKVLIDQPLMENLLADLSLESEAATLLVLRLARSYDTPDDSGEAAFKRVATAVTKYWICKRAMIASGEAMEVFGGNGYVEENIIARLYRDIPVNSIWEGSGNVICLDVLRALQKEEGTLPALMQEIEKGCGQDRSYDRFVEALKKEIVPQEKLETRARFLVEKLALGLQASLMIRQAPEENARAFVASRLNHEGGYLLGTLPPTVNFKKIIERSKPIL